ncbi:formyltransferase [uncultured Methylobacterium sp.]|uniref:formyltransferase n=1 Tax=uncultured Methylobacterium sp. TaxID=157278 RepID=UPI0035CBE05F
MAAWVNGDATNAEDAIAAAAALLADARAPILAGLNADVAAIRAAYRLAGTIGASVDTLGAAGTYAELGSLSRTGAMTTTPAEAVGRADVVLLVGATAGTAAIAGTLRGTKPVRGRAAGSERTVLSLEGSAAADPATVIAHLRACAKGHLAADAALGTVARALSAARYGVVLYDPAELGELGVEMLQGLVRDVNEAARCFALALDGADQDRAVVQVAAWTTGQAPRTGFGRRVPEHDPWRFDAGRQVAAGEADAVLWLSTLPAAPPPWLMGLPAVALVGAGSPEAAPGTAEIVIAVGVPGASTGGVLWNEGRAALTYRAGHGADLTAADVIARIQARLTGREEPSC